MEREELPRFVTVPRAARLVGLGRRQLREAIDRGELRPIRLKDNGWPRLSIEEIRRWLRTLRGGLQ